MPPHIVSGMENQEIAFEESIDGDVTYDAVAFDADQFPVEEDALPSSPAAVLAVSGASKEAAGEASPKTVSAGPAVYDRADPKSEEAVTDAPRPAHQTAPQSTALAGAKPADADDFSALEDRVLRAVELVRSARQARDEAQARVAALEAALQDQAPLVERLQQEVDDLRMERDQVRNRVERLLSQLDALEL